MIQNKKKCYICIDLKTFFASVECSVRNLDPFGTNLYLAKIALDIISKHVDENIGMLTEKMYQKYLWHHQPLTDFWHVGIGTMNHLARMGIYDMYGITQCPENILYKEFGINAEYIIDHA